MRFTKRALTSAESKQGLFLRLKDGESMIGIFRGEPYEFHQVWENGKSQVVSDDTPGAKTRFRLNFVTKENGRHVSKIYEYGIIVNNSLDEINEEYKDEGGLEKVAVKITRRGVGTDTTYSIMVTKTQPTAAQLKEFEAAPLNILNHPVPVAAPIKNHAPTGTDDGSDIPF